MEKPISMIIEETRKELINTINACGLHPSIMEMILKEIYQTYVEVKNNIEKQEMEKYLQNVETENDNLPKVDGEVVTE